MTRRRRDTGSRAALTKRARFWRGVQNGYRRAQTVDWSNWIKAIAAVGAVALTFWTSVIQQKGNETAKELTDLRAAMMQKEADYNAKMVTVNNRMDGCEKRMKDSDDRMKAIEEAAKKLPPSRTKRQILTLTKPQQSGKVVEPLRAEEPLPKFYSDFSLERGPSFDSRYFRRTN